MSTGATVGSVVGLWRFPVKSMSGERLEQAEITTQGLVGDRACALIDMETGKVASAKSVRLFPGLLGCRAAFVEPPRLGFEIPPVRITLPNGTTASSDDGNCDRVLSDYFRREVRVARAAPEDFTIDQYHPDVEGADPAGPPGHGCRAETRLVFLRRGWSCFTSCRRFVLRSLPGVRSDDLYSGSAQRASPTEPVRRAPISDERHRWRPRTGVCRKRVGRS